MIYSHRLTGYICNLVYLGAKAHQCFPQTKRIRELIPFYIYTSILIILSIEFKILKFMYYSLHSHR